MALPFSAAGRTIGCDPCPGRGLLCPGYRWCRFAQPPATCWDPLTGSSGRSTCQPRNGAWSGAPDCLGMAHGVEHRPASEWIPVSEWRPARGTGLPLRDQPERNGGFLCRGGWRGKAPNGSLAIPGGRCGLGRFRSTARAGGRLRPQGVIRRFRRFTPMRADARFRGWSDAVSARICGNCG